MSGERDTKWFVSKNKQRFGPFEQEELYQLITDGVVVAGDLVWRSGWENWRSFNDLPDLRGGPSATPNTQHQSYKVIVDFIKHGLDTPRRTIATIYDVIFRTADFSRTRIDIQPKDLSKSLLFYLSVFGFVFLLYTIIAKFSFYRGVDHKRELAFLAIQVAIGVIVLYAVNKVVRSNVTFRGTLQAVLYIDAPFLLFFAFVRLAVAFFGYHSSLFGRQPDVIENEFEGCVAATSYVYELLRGDLTFLLHADDPVIARGVDYFNQYGELFLILPFCLLFSKIMHYRFGTSVAINCVAGVAAYLIATTAFAKAAEFVRNTESNRSGCWQELDTRLMQKYSGEFLAQQAVLRINNRVATYRGVRSNWLLRNDDGDTFVNISATEDLKRAELTTAMRNAFYCGPDVEFTLIRALGLKFAVVYRTADGGVLEADVFKPSDCRALAGK